MDEVSKEVLANVLEMFKTFTQENPQNSSIKLKVTDQN